MLSLFVLYSKVTHSYINFLFYILFYYGLSQDIDYSSLCYIVWGCRIV